MPALPQDPSGNRMQLTPATVALARTVSSSLSSAQTITFNSQTSLVRIYATSQDVFLKWGTTAVTSSNFDEVIPAGQVVDLAVPKDTTGLLFTACTLLERNASASVIVIEK